MNERVSPPVSFQDDWEIAQAAHLEDITRIATTRLGIPLQAVEPYGRTKAKIGMDFIQGALARPATGKLVLVTAISPTPAGEGKTTTSVGLGDALNRIGKKTAICLREPSLGPCFGIKGGAAGGGRSQVVPMDEINLHFTGDLHAITAANNLLAAMIDNHLYWGNPLGLDVRRITWRRALDMNDRALRQTVCSLGGAANGYPREDGFDITVASEVMAIFCLALSFADLQHRLSDIIVGWTRDRKPVRARDLKASGAMAALLRDALKPNLVQTMENNPAFVHGGPFANIAHGCNSALATSLALRLADYVVTEAGFGADLGAEKFFDIKCRKTGLRPDAAVIVATVRALKMHGGVAKSALGIPDSEAVKKGLANLRRHLENLARFGVPRLVAINRFWTDSEAEIDAVRRGSEELGVQAILCEHWAKGGEGAEELAHAVVSLAGSGAANFRFLYPDELPLVQKIEAIATQLYGARGIELTRAAASRIKEFEEMGFGHLPVCMAKTQYSFSTDPELRGAPAGFTLPVREVRLCAGAGFVVVICGEIMTMPGLPRVPAAEGVSLGPDGQISGLS